MISLKTSDNGLLAARSFNSTDNILLWRAADERMIRIELWSALPDESERTVDFTEIEKYYMLGAG